MKRTSNQNIEKHYFEMFRKNFTLPDGNIIYRDKPDVILEGKRSIGIEITNFYLEKGDSSESEQAQRKLREKVVSGAQRIYRTENGKKIEITFGFEKANPIRDHKKLAKKIAALARHIEAWKTGVIRKDIFKGIPELSFVYLNAKEYDDAKWRGGRVYNGTRISRDGLIEIVRSKEESSKQYEKCDAYWLLVVVDFIDRAQDQEIQIDAFEKIESNVFEKIFVYKTGFGHVLEAK